MNEEHVGEPVFGPAAVPGDAFVSRCVPHILARLGRAVGRSKLSLAPVAITLFRLYPSCASARSVRSANASERLIPISLMRYFPKSEANTASRTTGSSSRS